MEEEKKKSKAPIVILVLILVIAAGIGGFFGGKYYFESKNKDEQKENQPEENTTEKEKTSDERTVEQIIDPFISIIGFNGFEKEEFYYKNINTYEDLPTEKAIQIALYNHTEDDWKEIENNKNKKADPNETDEFPDIMTSEIKDKIEYTFGKGKNISFPQKLSFENYFIYYELQGDRYVMSAQGGGFTGISPYMTKKVVAENKENDKLIVRVNIAYVTYVDDNVEELDEAQVTVYNSPAKKRIVAKDFKHSEEEKELNKIINGDDTDYLLFTFKTEDNHYIFEKVELVER